MVRLALSISALLVLLLVPTGATASDASEQDGPAIIPNLASSELAVGPNRFLFLLNDTEGQPIASPDVDVRLRFYDWQTDKDAVAFETESRFLWAIEDVSGLYASNMTFPHAGRWGTRFEAIFPDGTTETVRADYDVRETTSTPPIGAPAPVVDTPTAEDVGGELHLISTDPEPLARMYEMSIADAVNAGAPAVITFATPSFCQSATCGPTIEKIKAVADSHPNVNFVHVEPYVMTVQDDRLQLQLSDEGRLQAAPWTEAWGLLREPYVVVLAADGTVRAKYEGAISVDELSEALGSL